MEPVGQVDRMTLPPGWTDEMNIELPVGVSLEEVADVIISLKNQNSTHEMVESCLIEKFALTPYDAALARDRVCAGMVRASTGLRSNCPDRVKDALAWIAFQRTSADQAARANASIAQPDFSRYSEQQLRQILTRLDGERFPERLKEIEARLLAFDSSKITETQPEVPAGERQLISSSVALFANAIFPFFWFGILLFFAISFLVSKVHGISHWFFLFALFIFGVLGQLAINRLSEKVYLAGNTLILFRRGEKEIVYLKDVTKVEVSPGETTTIVLHLASPTKFGQRIEFVPALKFAFGPFKEVAVVDELNLRIAAAKAHVATA